MAEVEVDIDRNEEIKFVKLFDEVLQSLRRNLSDKDISEGAEKVVKYFIRGPSNPCTLGQDRKFNVMCGFFYRLSPLVAGLTRRKVSDAIQGCKEFKSCLEQPSLKMICFGCGPGNDLVGLFSALNEEAKFQELSVTLVDSNTAWEPFFEEIERLLREGRFGMASDLFKGREITTKFICSDMLNEEDAAYKEYLKEAKIAWMKGFLSVLESDDDRIQVTMLVINSMTPGSLLVVIDSKAYNNFDLFSDVLENVYSTEEKEPYEFKGITEKKYMPGLASISNQQIYIFVKK